MRDGPDKERKTLGSIKREGASGDHRPRRQRKTLGSVKRERKSGVKIQGRIRMSIAPRCKRFETEMRRDDHALMSDVGPGSCRQIMIMESCSVECLDLCLDLCLDVDLDVAPGALHLLV